MNAGTPNLSKMPKYQLDRLFNFCPGMMQDRAMTTIGPVVTCTEHNTAVSDCLKNVRSLGGVFAQRGHSANYYGDYPGNNPENHPPCGIMHNQFKTQKFKHLMLAMGPRDLNSAPYSRASFEQGGGGRGGGLDPKLGVPKMA